MNESAPEKLDLWQMYHELSQQQALDSVVLEQTRQAIATVTHDLKTPLTAVKLYADILLSQVRETDAETRSKYLAVISSEADRMSRMIANIVDYQNIISDMVEWHDEATDIVSIIAVCVKPVQRWCAAKGIGFNCTINVDSLVILIDADRLSRLLSVLLMNALRFTDSGRIKLELKSDGTRLTLAVSDSGPGISDERLQQLFQPCVGLVALGKVVGLAFAFSVVDHYQGRIWAENAVGNGAVFYIELPLLHETVGVQR